MNSTERSGGRPGEVEVHAAIYRDSASVVPLGRAKLISPPRTAVVVVLGHPRIPAALIDSSQRAIGPSHDVDIARSVNGCAERSVIG
jgi:hypothetical protein